MDVFIKKLEVESGYSGNKPNQRGKYILIPSSWIFSQSFRDINDVTVIDVLPNKKEIALSLVYQNSKFSHKRILHHITNAGFTGIQFLKKSSKLIKKL